MQTDHREIPTRQVAAQLRALGVAPGAVLLVHTSFRAVRPIENGLLGLIQALREAVGPDGTLVMPSWTDDDDRPFDPAASTVAPDLGVVADVFRRQPGVLRSNHAFAFAAQGSHAASITADPLPIPPHIPASPVGRVHQLDGQVLLLGVGHSADTTIHLGEVLAGVQYRLPHYITVIEDGRAVRLDYEENDCCCERFAFLDEWLGDLQTTGPAGHAAARLIRSRDIVRFVKERLEQAPLVFLHPPEAGCNECNRARRSLKS